MNIFKTNMSNNYTVSHGGSRRKYIDLRDGGTFTRSTEGSYLVSAPTDGTTAFLQWAAINQRRIENRGDGLGDMLLMEGARTNRVLRSRDLAGTSWGPGSGVLTNDQNGGPDGATLADRVNAGSGQIAPYALEQGSAGLTSIAVWRRAVAGSVNHQIFIGQGPSLATIQWAARAATTTWSRHDLTATATPGAAGYLGLDGRDGSTNGGQAAQAQDCYLDLHQMESAAFPSSPIRTTTTAVIRGVDVLSYAVGQYPASFLTRGFRFTFVPDFSSAELLASGAGNSLIHDSIGTNVLQFTVGSSPRFWVNGSFVDGSPLTYSRGQLLTFTVQPLAGRITVSGATAGNGSATVAGVAWPAGTLTIGSSGGAISAFGRFGTIIEAL